MTHKKIVTVPIAMTLGISTIVTAVPTSFASLKTILDTARTPTAKIENYVSSGGYSYAPTLEDYENIGKSFLLDSTADAYNKILLAEETLKELFRPK